MSPSPIIELERVTFSYSSHQVLRDLSLEIGEGLTFLVGENGAGKTTLMRLILGLERPGHGTVRIDGRKVGRTRGRQLSRVGYLPQEFSVPQHLKLQDFVAYMAWLRYVSRVEIGPATARALAMVGLTDCAQSRMGDLSGGMVRRAGIAQALVHSPDVLLLDEPTVGLDPARRVAMRELMLELGESVSILCSTHLLEDVSLTHGQMLVLADGQLAYDGPSTVLATTDEADLTTPTASRLESAFMRLVASGQDVR